MTTEEILGGLKEVLLTIKPHMDIESVKMESRLLEDLGIDSLAMLLMSLSIEQKFSFQFKPDDKFSTVADVVNTISSRI